LALLVVISVILPKRDAQCPEHGPMPSDTKDLPETISCTSHSSGDAETFGARAGQSRGRRGCRGQGQAGAFTTQRVTFTSCSVHAQFMFYPFWVLYISLYILFVSLCDTIFRTFNVQIVQCPAPPSSTCFDFRHVSIFSLKPAPAGRTRRRLQCSFNPMPPR